MPHITHWEGAVGVRQHCYDTVTGGERIGAMSKVFGDHRFDSLRYIIVDFLTTTKVVFTREESEILYSVYHGASHTNSRIVVALVCPRPEMLQAMIDLTGTYGSPFRHRMCLNVYKARQWIMHTTGLHPPVGE